MRLSELYAQLKTAGDVHAFSVYLATSDLDGVDVDLVPVGRVEVDYEKGEARLILLPPVPTWTPWIQLATTTCA